MIHREGRHDVGAVLGERDSAEPLRLALRAEVASRGVETRQSRIFLRCDLNHGPYGVPVAVEAFVRSSAEKKSLIYSEHGLGFSPREMMDDWLTTGSGNTPDLEARVSREKLRAG